MKKQMCLVAAVTLLAILTIGCTTVSRPVKEVFLEHHKMVETLGPQDADMIAADYAEDAVVILLDGTTLVGREAVEAGFQGFLTAFPNLDLWTLFLLN